MIKTISLSLEDIEIQLEHEVEESELIGIEFGRIEEDGTVINTVSVYPSIKEVKEIIKALQQILPEEESQIYID